jgi:hypothetical protein
MLRTADPTAEERAMAARELKTRLDWIVRQLDELNAQGVSDGDAWKYIRFCERKPTRRKLDARPGVMLALDAYAERSVISHRRLMRAICISELALRLSRDEASFEHAIRAADTARGDDYLKSQWALADLRDKVGAARNERSRWQAAYCALAWDADVWPVPERGRARSEGLAKLYRTSVEELRLRDLNREQLRLRNSEPVAHAEPPARTMSAR